MKKRNMVVFAAFGAAALFGSAPAMAGTVPVNLQGTMGQGRESCPDREYCLYDGYEFNNGQQQTNNRWSASGNWGDLAQVPQNTVSATDQPSSVVNNTGRNIFLWEHFGNGRCVTIPPGSWHNDLGDYSMDNRVSSVTVNPPDIHSCRHN